MYAKSRRPVFKQLPNEDWEDGMCGRLNVSLYGTRDAASNWENTYSDALISAGFVPGISSPCTFYHPVYDIRVVVHAVDFTFLGTDEAMDFPGTP